MVKQNLSHFGPYRYDIHHPGYINLGIQISLTPMSVYIPASTSDGTHIKAHIYMARSRALGYFQLSNWQTVRYRYYNDENEVINTFRRCIVCNNLFKSCIRREIKPSELTFSLNLTLITTFWLCPWNWAMTSRDILSLYGWWPSWILSQKRVKGSKNLNPMIFVLFDP